MTEAMHRVMVWTLAVLLLTSCQAMTGKTAGRHVDDATITATVKTRLAEYDAESLTRISVKTDRAVVYLTGTVEKASSKQKAEEIAAGVGGVARVVNGLQVGGP